MSNEFNGFDINEDDSDKTELEWGDSFDDIDIEENDDSDNDSDITNRSKKRTAVVIILAIVLIIIASIIYRVYKSNISKNVSTNTYSVSDNYNSTDDINVNNETKYSSDDVWSSVDNSQNINDSGYVNTVFTVTSMQHQARVNCNEIEIRTIVTGSISGFTGTYEIIIPYNKGAKLKVADTFDICVYTGKYGEKTVVTGIEY